MSGKAKGTQRADQSNKFQSTVSDHETAPDDFMEQAAIEQCPDCMERLLAFLADPDDDEADKVEAARNWIKPESEEETLSLLYFLKDANETKQYELQDQLLQVLAESESNESAELLIAVISGDVPEFSFQELPEELQYAVKKAINLNPKDERIGQMLAENYGYQTSPEAVEAIQDVNQPILLYYLAQEADWKGEPERASHFIQSLQTLNDTRALGVIMCLGDENIITEGEATQIAYDWVNSNRESFDQKRYEAYLSEPDADPTERIVAGAALAASGNPENALMALEKHLIMKQIKTCFILTKRR